MLMSLLLVLVNHQDSFRNLIVNFTFLDIVNNIKKKNHKENCFIPWHKKSIHIGQSVNYKYIFLVIKLHC